MDKSQFSEQTIRYIETSDTGYRKSLGQYFTPKAIRDQLLGLLPAQRGAHILDPSCGTGEFLLSAQERFEAGKLEGWEIDKKLARLSARLIPEAIVMTVDALDHVPGCTYDFVIGNPPYFEFQPSSSLRQRFRDIISGRANIFAFFIKIGLDVLKPGGYLAYVVPPSMNNGRYFSGLRDYIVRHASIESLSVLDSPLLFNEANQSVMLLVLKKGGRSKKYQFEKNGIRIFSTSPGRLSRQFQGKTTLKELGFAVRTGRIVWNQHKEKLTVNPDNAIPLIRAHNIADGGLSLDNSKSRPQYITGVTPDQGPAIVVNRVTGSAGRANLKAAVIPAGMKFVGENHVNIIFPPSGSYPLSALEELAWQIRSEAVLDSVRLITGNTQVSRTELECLLPLSL